jgi:hypothetical protein
MRASRLAQGQATYTQHGHTAHRQADRYRRMDSRRHSQGHVRPTWDCRNSDCNYMLIDTTERWEGPTSLVRRGDQIWPQHRGTYTQGHLYIHVNTTPAPSFCPLSPFVPYPFSLPLPLSLSLLSRCRCGVVLGPLVWGVPAYCCSSSVPLEAAKGTSGRCRLCRCSSSAP